MTWIIVPDPISFSGHITLIVSNLLTAVVTWYASKWYNRHEVVYSYLTVWNMVFLASLAVVITILVVSGLHDAPNDAWHDEEMMDRVRETRTNARAREQARHVEKLPIPPVRRAITEAELIAHDTAIRRRQKFIAVKEGRINGIFENWETARQYVEGHSHAKYMAFRTLEDATAWLDMQI